MANINSSDTNCLSFRDLREAQDQQELQEYQDQRAQPVIPAGLVHRAPLVSLARLALKVLKAKEVVREKQVRRV